MSDVGLGTFFGFVQPEPTNEWYGTDPKVCQLCHKDIVDEFVDGATTFGPWGIMCIPCHAEFGRGLGVGCGQRYKRISGKWIKQQTS